MEQSGSGGAPYAPHLGIFWFVLAAGVVELVARGCPLDAAERYDDCLTFAGGHYETWTAWQRREIELPSAAAHNVVLSTEYDNWPRGRIIYQVPTSRFVIYADRQLLAGPRLARIRTAFGLPEGTLAAGDAHYSRAMRLPPEDGFRQG